MNWCGNPSRHHSESRTHTHAGTHTHTHTHTCTHTHTSEASSPELLGGGVLGCVKSAPSGSPLRQHVGLCPNLPGTNLTGLPASRPASGSKKPSVYGELRSLAGVRGMWPGGWVWVMGTVGVGWGAGVRFPLDLVPFCTVWDLSHGWHRSQAAGRRGHR